MTLKYPKNITHHYEPDSFITTAAGLVTVRALSYSDFLRNYICITWFLLFIAVYLILSVINRSLAAAQIEKPARSGIWMSAIIGMFTSIFLPNTLHGFIKDLIFFSGPILAFVLVYVWVRWIMNHVGKGTASSDNPRRTN